VTATIPVGNMFGVAVNPRNDTIYLANTGADTMSVINGRTNSVTATVPVGGAPVNIAVNPNAKTIYVTNEDAGTVSVLAPCRK
jgi:YVTN family beta-propeller protein